MDDKAIIIPVGAGKGGVGKSFITANLGMALAQRGHRTILVDLDLGGSNLHAFLGIPNRYPGVGDFLQARRGRLADHLLDTGQAGLQLLPGDGKSPFMANISHAQKTKLIGQLRRLEADFVLLDLSAGATYHTLDFFNLAPYGLVVTVPEHHAIMNMLAFLKNARLRSIERGLARRPGIARLLRDAFRQPLETQPASIAALCDAIAAEDPAGGRQAADRVACFRPRIVFNMGDHPDEMRLAGPVAVSLKRVLDLEADFFGFIFTDPAVRRAVRTHTPFLTHHRETPAALELQRIAERIEKYWTRTIPDSAAILAKRVREACGSKPSR